MICAKVKLVTDESKLCEFIDDILTDGYNYIVEVLIKVFLKFVSR